MNTCKCGSKEAAAHTWGDQAETEESLSNLLKRRSTAGQGCGPVGPGGLEPHLLEDLALRLNEEKETRRVCFVTSHRDFRGDRVPSPAHTELLLSYAPTARPKDTCAL